MNKPLTINLQINVYPDGTVQVNGEPHSQPAAVAVSTLELPSTPSTGASSPSPASSTPAPSSNSTGSGADGPSETDVRTALLAAVKASDKATAVGVLESIASVNRVPDVPADKREAVIDALNKIIAAAAKPAEA